MTETLYTKSGQAVVVDARVGSTIYARPMMKVAYQIGEDELEEVGEPSESISKFDVTELFKRPPVAIINEEIELATAKMESAHALLRKEQQELTREKISAEKELCAAQRTLEQWKKKHQVISDLGRLLDGEEIFPLCAVDRSYFSAPNIPYVPEMKLMDLLTLSGGDREWRLKSYSGSEQKLRFFHSEQDRLNFISAQFDTVLSAFHKRPNYSDDGKTYSTTLDFGLLSRWVERHPHLAMPEDVIAGKKSHEDTQRSARAEKLKAELESLSAPSN